MNWIFVVSDAGTLWNIYHVNHAFQQNSGGEVDVTLNNRDDIGLIAFYGRTPDTVPDSTNAVFLLSIGVAALFVYRRWTRHSHVMSNSTVLS
jgi:hypothetical protein